MASAADLMEAIKRNLALFTPHARTSTSVLATIGRVDRRDFVGVAMLEHAYEDIALPIGFGQTCSQPSVVAMMASLLEFRQGMRVLEIGLGCGHSAAITKHLIGKTGHLVSIELIPELHTIGTKNLQAHFGYDAVDTQCMDGSLGYPLSAPYDRIYLTAGVGPNFDPKPLASQLRPAGMLLYPQARGALIIWKDPSGQHIDCFDGFAFVPLRGKNA